MSEMAGGPSTKHPGHRGEALEAREKLADYFRIYELGS